MIEIRSSPRGGRGVFATEDIPDETLLMEAPLLMVPAEQREALKQTIVDDYVYEWDGQGAAALVLGPSSMCNHDRSPNAYLWLVPDNEAAELWSIRPISAGEEVTVSYRAAGDDEPLWFEVVEG